MFKQDKDFNFVPLNDQDLFSLIRDKFVTVFDFDGVITSPYALKTEFLNKRGHIITEEECSAVSCIKRGISREDHDYAIAHSFAADPAHLPLERGFKENFRLLRKIKGLAMFILTSRSDELISHLERYLKYHNIRVDGILYTQNRSKTELLKKVRANVFVDDSPIKLWEITRENPESLNQCSLILYRNVSNKNERLPHSAILEECDWNGIYSLIVTHHKLIKGV